MQPRPLNLLAAFLTLVGLLYLATESPGDWVEDISLINNPSVMVEGGTSELVHPNESGQLEYAPDPDNNLVCDFSYAGYRGGGVAIPDVPVALTLEPSGTDDTVRIQQAIDQIALKPPDGDGVRGALLLKKGKYIITDTLWIRSGGIVLRGEGAGFGGTWIYHKVSESLTDPTPGEYVHITQPEKGIIPSIETHGGRLSSTKVADVEDDLIPAGHRTLTLSDVSALSEGDEILVVCRQTQAWMDALGLQAVWSPEDFVITLPRTVETVNAASRQITLNVPVSTRIDIAGGYATAEVNRVTSEDRLRNVGIEDILFLSGYDRSKTGTDDYYNDENHPNMMVRFYDVRDSWIRRCVAFFYSYGLVRTGNAVHVTVEDCAMLDGVSQDTPAHHTGARKYYYDNNCDHMLVQRCYGRYARHAFIGNWHIGGGVFLDCYSERDHLPSEWHQKWGHGYIYDNVFCQASLNIGGNFSAHGQRGAFALIWNCFVNNRRTWTHDIWVNKLDGLFMNYAIGNIHRGNGTTGLGESTLGEVGIIESDNRFVAPRSLYLAQLGERLGENTTRAVATRKQIDGPRGASWLNLIDAYAELPVWEDPEQAPWEGWETWIPEYDPPAGEEDSSGVNLWLIRSGQE